MKEVRGEGDEVKAAGMNPSGSRNKSDPSGLFGGRNKDEGGRGGWGGGRERGGGGGGGVRTSGTFCGGGGFQENGRVEMASGCIPLGAPGAVSEQSALIGDRS